MKAPRLACSAIDDAYLWPWMIMIHSAHKNSGNVKVKYLLANVNELLSPQAEILACDFGREIGIDLEVRKFTSDLKSQYEFQFNITVYARIILMDELAEDFLWLDSDLLLLPGWSNIFDERGDYQGKDCVFHAVKDIKQTRNYLEREDNAAYRAAGERYFNTGVLRASPKNWRKLPESKRWIALASDLKGHSLKYPDQDVLNLLGAKHTSLLPSGYNSIVGSSTGLTDPLYIKHYAGSPKPWTMSRPSKEFLLTIQGANYFREEHSIMTLRDAFTEYPAYWETEKELLELLKRKNPALYRSVEENRSKNIKSVDLASRVKNNALKFLTRKFR
jgi:lipopolysaccharide biosynthesis glycosyltransferase